jgi:hypothetical protein
VGWKVYRGCCTGPLLLGLRRWRPAASAPNQASWRRPRCRFIKNNLLVEITSDRRLALLFSLALRRHTIISYSLYIAGGWRWSQRRQPLPLLAPCSTGPPGQAGGC